MLPPLTDPVPGPDARHAVLEQLRKAQYHRDDPSVVDRAWNWVAHRLSSLFSGSPGGNTMLVLLVLLAAVVIFAVVRAGPPTRSARRAGRGAEDPLRPVAATDHRRLAERYAADAQWADALREWLRAAVQTIEARDVLVPRPGRTGAAVAREAGALLPSAAGDLAAATAAFDEVWFGGRAGTQADAAVARAAADEVRAAQIAEPARAAGFTVPQ
jgi:hypothetical protein